MRDELLNIADKWPNRFTNPEAYRNCRIEMTAALLDSGAARDAIKTIVDAAIVNSLMPRIRKIVASIELGKKVSNATRT